MVAHFLVLVGLGVTVLYHQRPAWLWLLCGLGYVVVMTAVGLMSWLVFAVYATLLFALAAVMLIPSLRCICLSDYAYRVFMRQRPKLSETEKAAIDAGTVGVEADIFQGKLAWDQWLKQPPCQLSPKEQAFVDGPVTLLCRQVNDWEITHELKDLPPETWALLKKEGFFGMIIPESYGGLGFSQWAHALVIEKLAAYSVSLATTVSVPNSIGPAELLMAYGTEAQKQHYLPRLACGDEIPCFALTGPWAGSDATAMADVGVIARGIWQGEEVLGLCLQWKKRYITLAPVATLIGLAFKCYDPDALLGDVYDLGITVALVPSDSQGVVTGKRHAALDSAFLNGPTQGHDVFVPLSCVVGGQDRIGQGWQMLMESLATGRATTLPSMALGSASMAVMDTVAYAQVREQFNHPISDFTGVALPCARMVVRLYQIQALQHATVARLMQGEKPSLASAISKYHCTELARKIINDAMDVQGGRGICLGPLNTIGRIYQQTPISITVEGANLLTRNLMIFGQGAVRCHPFVLQELKCAQMTDTAQAMRRFDRLLWPHMGYLASQGVRAFVLSIAKARWLKAQALPSALQPHLRMATRWSAALAFTADLMMVCFGQRLKRDENMSARLGDILSDLYGVACVLQYHHQQGCAADDERMVDVCCHSLLYHAQLSFDAVLAHVPRVFACLLRAVVLPWGRPLAPVKDALLLATVTSLMGSSQSGWRRLFGRHLSAESTHPALRASQALPQIWALRPLEKKLHEVLKDQELDHLTYEQRVDAACSLGHISPEEGQQLKAGRALRKAIIGVDAFDQDQL